MVHKVEPVKSDTHMVVHTMVSIMRFLSATPGDNDRTIFFQVASSRFVV